MGEETLKDWWKNQEWEKQTNKVLPEFYVPTQSLISSLRTSFLCFAHGKTKGIATKSILIEGVSGSGKTYWLQRAISLSSFPFVWVEGGELAKLEESERIQKLHHHISNARERSHQSSLSFLILDDLDSICPPGTPKEETNSITSLLCDTLDSQKLFSEKFGMMVIIGVVPKNDCIHPRLLLPSRFGSATITFSTPTWEQRYNLCLKYCQKILASNQEKIAQEVTQRTAGYLIADIIRVFQDSLKISFFEKEGGEGGERGEKVEGRHIFEALGRSRASILMGEEGVRGGKGEDGEKEKGEEGEKEGLFVIDLAAVTYIRQELHLSVLYPLLNPLVFLSLRALPPSGILISGPSGTGKTTCALALCSAAAKIGVNVIQVEGTSVRGAVMGSSERNVRNLFERARYAQPAILLIDHIEALGGKRGNDSSSHSSSDRLLSCLLTEMDGVTTQKSTLTVVPDNLSKEEKEEYKEREADRVIRNRVIVIGVTSHPELLDEALVRPGRFDVHLRTTLPDVVGCEEILRHHLKKTPLAPEVTPEFLTQLSELCVGKSGAEIGHICREAAMRSLRENIHATHVTKCHLLDAIQSEWHIPPPPHLSS